MPLLDTKDKIIDGAQFDQTCRMYWTALYFIIMKFGLNHIIKFYCFRIGLFSWPSFRLSQIFATLTHAFHSSYGDKYVKEHHL